MMSGMAIQQILFRKHSAGGECAVEQITNTVSNLVLFEHVDVILYLWLVVQLPFNRAC